MALRDFHARISMLERGAVSVFAKNPSVMKISLKTDTILSQVEEEVLAANLGVKLEKLQSELERLAVVAMADLLDMLTGRTRETLTTQAYSKRLEYMTIYYYCTRLPREDEIVRLFQLTPARARTLLTNVQNARRFAIELQRNATVAAALTAARKVQGDEKNVVLAISSPSVLSAIRAAIETRTAGQGYNSLRKSPGKVDEYKVSCLTFNKIAPEFGVDTL